MTNSLSSVLIKFPYSKIDELSQMVGFLQMNLLGRLLTFGSVKNLKKYSNPENDDKFPFIACKI